MLSRRKLQAQTAYRILYEPLVKVRSLRILRPTLPNRPPQSIVRPANTCHLDRSGAAAQRRDLLPGDRSRLKPTIP